MAVDHSNDGRRGLGALLRDLAEGSAELVRGEVRLARLELGGATHRCGARHASTRRSAACCSCSALWPCSPA